MDWVWTQSFNKELWTTCNWASFKPALSYTLYILGYLGNFQRRKTLAALVVYHYITIDIFNLASSILVLCFIYACSWICFCQGKSLMPFERNLKYNEDCFRVSWTYILFTRESLSGNWVAASLYSTGGVNFSLPNLLVFFLVVIVSVFFYYGVTNYFCYSLFCIGVNDSGILWWHEIFETWLYSSDDNYKHYCWGPFCQSFFFILLLLFLIDGVFLSCGDFVSLNDVEMMNMHWALSKLFISCLIDA